MKKLLFLLLAFICFTLTSCEDCGCMYKTDSIGTNLFDSGDELIEAPVYYGSAVFSQNPKNPIKIIEMDSCEYLRINLAGSSDAIFIHRGNCKYCKERNRKMFESVLEEYGFERPTTEY